MAQPEKYPEMRAPKMDATTTTPTSNTKLSIHAAEFVPKCRLTSNVPFTEYMGYPIQDGRRYQSPIVIHQTPTSHVHQRFAMAQGGGEGSGGGGGGGGGGYEYATPMTLQNRLSNMQIVDGGGNGKEFNHHHHQQQPMHHQQHRGQQHHGYHHHHQQQQQQQQHQAYGSYGYQNNHHVQQQGGMGGDHRKYNNGGQQQQQHHHNNHRSRPQHQHHHHQSHHQHQQQYGGNHQHDYMDGGGPAAAGGYNNMMGPNWDSNFQEDIEQISYRQTQAMDYLTGVIAELFDNPGLFDDSVKKKLPEKLGDLRQDHYVLSSTIEMIFEQSIRESNFRYMGARLCKLLDSLNNGPNLALRELLRLKMEDQSGELPQFMKHEQVKVRGATLFLAELYMQLRDPQQPFGKTISEHIINAIEILLGKEGPENTKCVCQCLKLCGYELEQDCPEKVETILNKLENQTNVQSSTEAMIRSVFTLRKNAWGRREEPVAAVPPMPVPTEAMLMGGGASVAQNLPVFYGPDGKVLTEEEHSFLSTNVTTGHKPNAYNDYDDDDEYGLVDPNDDLEIQEAYEDFIQSSGQNQRNQQQYRPNA